MVEGSAVWVRGVLGVLLCLTGGVWFLQGLNVLHGSFMSGRGQYTAFGVVVFLLGAALLVWATRRRRVRD